MYCTCDFVSVEIHFIFFGIFNLCHYTVSESLRVIDIFYTVKTACCCHINCAILKNFAPKTCCYLNVLNLLKRRAELLGLYYTCLSNDLLVCYSKFIEEVI